MPSISRSVDIEASPDAVWATITDFDRYGEWNVTHQSFPEAPPSPLATGSTFKEKVKIMGMPGEVAWAVTELDEGSRLALDGKGPMGTHLNYDYSLESVNGGTRVNAEAEFGGAALGPMAGQLEKQSAQALDESLEKLKGLLA